jgi:hypothetical protein
MVTLILTVLCIDTCMSDFLMIWSHGKWTKFSFELELTSVLRTCDSYVHFQYKEIIIPFISCQSHFILEICEIQFVLQKMFFVNFKSLINLQPQHPAHCITAANI